MLKYKTLILAVEDKLQYGLFDFIYLFVLSVDVQFLREKIPLTKMDVWGELV